MIFRKKITIIEFPEENEKETIEFAQKLKNLGLKRFIVVGNPLIREIKITEVTE